MTTRKSINFIGTKAPNLPLPAPNYSQSLEAFKDNALRLYFNQIDNLSQWFAGGNFGANVISPFISACDTAVQYATGNNTPTIVQWNALGGANQITLNEDNTATAQYPGYYKITYSAQLANNDSAAHDAIFWLRVNGTDVENSATIFTIPARKSAGVASYVCGYSEVLFHLNANDIVGLWWGTDQAATSGGATGISIYQRAAQTTPMAYPATPSVIGSIVFVSAG